MIIIFAFTILFKPDPIFAMLMQFLHNGNDLLPLIVTPTSTSVTCLYLAVANQFNCT